MGSETAIGSLAGNVSIKASSSASYSASSLGSAAGFWGNLVELGEVRRGQFQRHRAEVFLEVRHLRRSRNREHHWRVRQQPGERDLTRLRIVPARDLGDSTIGKRSTFDRAPREERDLLQRAEVEDGLRSAFKNAVAVLDRDDRRELLRPLHLLNGHVRQSDVPNLALGFEFHQRADRFLERDLRIGAVKLIDIDLFDAEALQAALTGGA